MFKIGYIFVLGLSLLSSHAKDRPLLTVPIPNLPEGAKELELVWIEPGAFMMGSNVGDPDERPIHQVTITNGFYLGKYEVTQAQYQAITQNNISFYYGDNKPVENVQWVDAQAFIENLNQKELGYQFRLPTEAEWEHACRAGTTTEYFWGDGDINNYAWTTQSNVKGTSEVGLLLPNPWGLYDMSGNVWEWCSDIYKRTYYAESPGIDPQGPEGGVFRSARGGSWYKGPQLSRSATRIAAGPPDTGGSLGFRLAADTILNVTQ